MSASLIFLQNYLGKKSIGMKLISIVNESSIMNQARNREVSDFLPLSRISSRMGFELGMATYARVGKSFGLISWKVHLSHILRNDILAGGVAASGFEQ